MNCKELQHEIMETEAVYNKLKEQYGNATDSGRGRKALLKTSEELSDKVDQLLGKYLNNFFEHFPEVFCRLEEEKTEWVIKEDFPFPHHFPIGKIMNHISLPDGSLMMETMRNNYHFVKDDNGNWQPGELSEWIDSISGEKIKVSSATPLSSGDIMIIGRTGKLYYATSNGGGEKWELKRLEGILSADGDKSRVRAVAQLQDSNNIMVGGEGGALYCATLDDTGNWQLGKRIDGFKNIHDESVGVHSIIKLPDYSGIMVGGEGGALYCATLDDTGNWQLGKRIDGFWGDDNGMGKNEYGEPTHVSYDGTTITFPHPTITDIIPFSDGAILRAGSLLYFAQKDSIGEWRLGEKLDWSKDAEGNNVFIRTVARLPKNIVVVGGRGGFYIVSQNSDGSPRLSKRINIAQHEHDDVVSIDPISSSEVRIRVNTIDSSPVFLNVTIERSVSMLKKALQKSEIL